MIVSAEAHMRYAILGDIHANWEALSRVLDDARDRGVDAYVSVGDLVGYNADPRRCLEAIRALNCRAVRGNHDHYCVHPPVDDHLSDTAAAALTWTRCHLSPEEMKFLSELPLTIAMEDFAVVHNSLRPDNHWEYVVNTSTAEASFAHQTSPVCFHGHTHFPVVFSRRTAVTAERFTKLELDPEARYFINVGSVGQPRDRDPRAAYAIYDLDARTVELHRVAYDATHTQTKIAHAGLPSWLGLRLLFGM
jgi:diadenosine tetraphosphatase ApaH/serine/threonine PP2A family protein phosphatase